MRARSLGRYAYQRRETEEKHNPNHNGLGQFSSVGSAHLVIGRDGSRKLGPMNPANVEQHTVPSSSPYYVDGINNKEVMKLSAEVRGKAIKNDSAITGDVKRITKATGGTLAGLDFRIKSDTSMRSKIVLDSNKLMTDYKTAASFVKDGLRYTTLLPTEKYTSGVNKQLEAFKNAGYTVSRVRNTWGRDGYKGINAVLKKNGVVLEYQFHTKESFAAKNDAHGLYYEKLSKLPAGSKESLALQKEMDAFFAKIPVPTGVASIPSS